jgi:hypothetical protein
MKVLGMLLGVVLLYVGFSFVQADAAPHGSWKYLGGYTFVHIDESQRAFQCRIDRDMNVFFAVAKVKDGEVAWSPTRYFSIYGKEIDLSGQSWGEGTVEHRGRILFLNPRAPSGNSNERLELDPVATLPTICQYYLQISHE